MPFNSWFLLARLLGDEEDYSTNDLGVGSSSVIHYFLALFHLMANLCDKLLISCSGKALKVFSEVHNQKAAFVI